MYRRVVMGAGLLHSAVPASGGTRPFRPHPCMHSRHSSCASGGDCRRYVVLPVALQVALANLMQYCLCAASTARAALSTEHWFGCQRHRFALQDRTASHLTQHVLRATLTFVNCRKCGRSAVRPQLRSAHQRCRGYCRRDNDGVQCT